MTESYKAWISKASKERGTRLILALDMDGDNPKALLSQSQTLLRNTLRNLCAVKFGRHTVLNLGVFGTKRLINIVHDDHIPCIIDDKINDIGEINLAIARAYFRMGFDAIIANPFAGWRGGLDPLFQATHEAGHGVILLTYMSHPGAEENYGQKIISKHKKPPEPQYLLFANNAVRWRADGVVVGATRPKIIREVKNIVRDKVPIYSPGIGAQGGQFGTTSKAGTDYFIVGRSLTKSPNPGKTALEYARQSLIWTSPARDARAPASTCL